MSDINNPTPLPPSPPGKLGKWHNLLYIIYLLLLIAVAGLQILQNDRIEKLVVSDEIGLYETLQRPLEGKWHYELDWKKFHGDSLNKYMSYGDAFFIWDSKNVEYDVLIGYRIKRLHKESNNSIVVAYMIGKLKSCQKGFPVGNIHHLQYGGRMSKEFATSDVAANTEFFEMINLKFENINRDNKIYKIIGECDLTDGTKGIITFTR